jgi:hypothetical protein
MRARSPGEATWGGRRGRGARRIVYEGPRGIFLMNVDGSHVSAVDAYELLETTTHLAGSGDREIAH